MEPVKNKIVQRKKVTVRYTGPIMPLGGIYGPTVPQIMDVHVIAALLTKKYRTVEILNNGSEVELNMSNYNVDLNGDGGESTKEIVKPVEAAKPIPKKENKSVEEKKPEEKKEETPVLKNESQKHEEEKQQENSGIKINTNTPEKKEETVHLSVNNNNKQNNNQNNNQKQQQSTSMSKADKLVSK